MSGIVRIVLQRIRARPENVLRPVLVDHQPFIRGARIGVFIERPVVRAGDVGRRGRGHGRRGNKLAIKRRRKVVEGARAIEIIDAALI